ncbi:MAG: hypothetical protein QM594_18620 [Niabella sp.]
MTKYLIYIFAATLLLVACEREKDLELPDSTVEVLNYDGSPIIQEPNGAVTIDITAQSVAGIENIEVLINGAVVETVTPGSSLSYHYTYTYTIPGNASLGTVYDIVFRVNDRQGRVKESKVVKVSVNEPYTIDEFSFEGTAYQRVKGRVNKNLTLTKDKKWLMDSIVVVDEGATLTIQPGTTVYFRTFTGTVSSMLSINRGSKMVAVGTRTEPIVFTSSKTNENAAAIGDWGGILVHGEAPSNVGTSVLYGGFRYGGNKPADNSGSLKYIRIEYSGKNDMHGMQLFGVGSATSVEYVQVFKCYNNAFRIRGGRVSLRYIAGIEHGGYGIWADEGWQGNGQFWLFQTGIKATLLPVNYWNQARSIEFRNNDAIFDKQPRTTFKVSNVTLIGNGYQSGTDNGTRRGVRIRTGSQGFLYNAIVTQFPGDGVRVEDLPISDLGVNTIINHIHSYNNQANWEQDAKSFFFEGGQYNLKETAIPGISVGSFDAVASTSYNPSSMGSWFVSAPYIGAVNPAADWTKGGVWFKDKDGLFR